MRSPSTAARMTLESVWYALCTVAGAKPDAVRSATHTRTSSCEMRPNAVRPNVGSTWLRWR